MLVPLRSVSASTSYYQGVVQPSEASHFYPFSAFSGSCAFVQHCSPDEVGTSGSGGGGSGVFIDTSVASPFAGDPDGGGVLRVGGDQQYQVSSDNSGNEGVPISGAFAFGGWFRFVSHASGTQENLLGWERTWTAGCNCFFDQSGGLYLNTPDAGASLCFGYVGGPGRCLAWGQSTAWNYIMVVSDGAGDVRLFWDGALAHTLTGMSGMAASAVPWLGDAANLSTSDQLDVWGLGVWYGSAAVSNLYNPCSSTNAFCQGNGTGYYAMFLYTGTGAGSGLPTGTLPPAPTGSGACSSGTVGPVSNECKWLIPTLALNQCSAPDSIWNIGSDIGYGLCSLGNVFITALNGVITGLNYVVDLIEPGPSVMSPFSGLWQALQSHVPFSYVTGLVGSLTTAIGAAGSTHITLSWDGHTYDLTAAMAPISHVDVPLAACFLAGCAVELLHRVREDVSEDH